MSDLWRADGFSEAMTPPAGRADRKRPKELVAGTPEQQRRVTEIWLRSIADGTHGPGAGHVCGGCREWVAAIWYVTLTGTRLCRACAAAAGRE